MLSNYFWLLLLLFIIVYWKEFCFNMRYWIGLNDIVSENNFVWVKDLMVGNFFIYVYGFYFYYDIYWIKKFLLIFNFM